MKKAPELNSEQREFPPPSEQALPVDWLFGDG